jgi:hypothetical protein
VPVSRMERRARSFSLPPRAARCASTTSSTGDGVGAGGSEGGEEHAAIEIATNAVAIHGA